MKCPEVAILLATYNGEKYIGAQLDSLLRQKNDYQCGHLCNTDLETKERSTDFRIYIHDDGSRDNTVSIIRSYVEKYPNRIKIIEGPSTGGAKNNFFYLMRKVSQNDENNKNDMFIDTPRYFFFSDQDDIWLKDKIETELKIIRKLEKKDGDEEEFPSLVWCDMKVVDEELKTISSSFSEYSHLEPAELDLDRCIMHGKVAGCSMVCNAKLIEKCCEIIDTKNIIMHDWALFLIARMIGRVYYIDAPLVLYRQHENNGIGAQKEGRGQILKSIIDRILSMKQLKATQENLKRYIGQVACLIQVRDVYLAHQQLIDGAYAFESMKRIDKVRFVNRFKLYRHKHSRVWASVAAFLMA